MLNALLTKFYSAYPALLDFQSIEQFDDYYNKAWQEFDVMRQEEQEQFIKRSEIQNGSHKETTDEEARVRYIKSLLQVSSLVPNIANAINGKNSLDLQKAMFNSCISEIDLLNSELQEKNFLISKYPFIGEELSQLREGLFVQCSHLADTAKAFQSHQIKWLGQTNTLAAFFFDLWKGQSKDLNGTSKDLDPIIDVKSARVIQEFIAANFTDKEGNKWEAADFKDYFSKSEKRENIQKRILLRYKK